MLKRRTPLRRGASPLKRSRLRAVSKKRAGQFREYSEKRKAYLIANPVCEVWLRLNNWRRSRTGLLGAAWYERASNGGVEFAEVSATILLQNFRAPASTEIHHTNKRRGEMLNDESYWLAVCRENHERIENNKSWARENGFLLNF